MRFSSLVVEQRSDVASDGSTKRESPDDPAADSHVGLWLKDGLDLMAFARGAVNTLEVRLVVLPASDGVVANNPVHGAAFPVGEGSIMKSDASFQGGDLHLMFSLLRTFPA